MDRKNPPIESQEGRKRSNEGDCQVAEEEHRAQSPQHQPDGGDDQAEKVNISSNSDNPSARQRQDVADSRNGRELSRTGRQSPPPLPDTISFVQNSKRNKKRSVRQEAASGDSKSSDSTKRAKQQRREKHKREDKKISSFSKEQPVIGVTKKEEFMMESLFSMLLYLKRSTNKIPITIPLLHSTDHPMLLTLASYPFRVLFANDAHQNLRGCNDMVGRTLFECFESDEDMMNPSLAFYPSFLKLILDGRPCYINSRDRDGHVTAKVCTIKAEEVFSTKEEGESLQYYAIHFIVAT